MPREERIRRLTIKHLETQLRGDDGSTKKVRLCEANRQPRKRASYRRQSWHSANGFDRTTDVTKVTCKRCLALMAKQTASAR